MRKLVIAIGIVLAVIMAAPFLIGILAERSVRNELQSISSNELVTLRIASYDRGWLDSSARIELGIGESYLKQVELVTQQPAVAEMLRSVAIPFIVDFTHGPILVGDHSGFGFIGVKAYPDSQNLMIQMVQRTLGMPYLFELEGTAGFGTGFEFSGEIPSIDGTVADSSYEFSGLDVTGLSKGDHVDFVAVIESASLQGPFMSAVLDSFRMTGDYTLRPGTFSLGRMETSLGRLAAINPSLGATPMFTADNLRISTTTTENAEGTHFDMEMIYGIGRLAAAGTYEISDASLGLRLTHIDSLAASEIITAASAMQATDDLAEMTSELLPQLNRLVAGSPGIAIDPLKFTLAEGDFNARLRIGIDGSALPTGSANDLMNPAVAMGAISADADLAASKPLVQMLARLAVAWMTPAILDANGQPLPREQQMSMVDAQVSRNLGMMTTLGLVRDDGESLSSALRLADGSLTANGKPLPLGF
jgi:uncharacterized protein YdgA (DUF945 family)